MKKPSSTPAIIVLLLLVDSIIISFFSAIVAYALFLVGKPFVPSFLFAFSVIALLGILSNIVVTGKDKRKLATLEHHTAKMLTSQTLVVACAYCRVENERLINLTEDMAFKCVSCKQPNKIIINYGSARTTTPLNVEANLNDIIPDHKPVPELESMGDEPNG